MISQIMIAGDSLRPSWDDIWMELAKKLSGKSTCQRAHVGSVVVSRDNQRVLAIGYNGNYKGGPNHCDSDKEGQCGCLHAEDNACIKLDFNDPVSKVLYTTVSPCLMCTKRIINSGIKEVVYMFLYRISDHLSLLTDRGIIVRSSDNTFTDIISKKEE